TDTPCDSSDCNDKGVCLGTKANYICACSPGFLGQRCELVQGSDPRPQIANSLCDLSDCNNSGICIGTKGMPSCVCSLGFNGMHCEIGSYFISISAKYAVLKNWKQYVLIRKLLNGFQLKSQLKTIRM
ncbi:unnamed protein product, partial [Gongylonema pulchrum]|uniref:EGF-like domain-containing protein n=1 Tax=Gongylonema pulchrum TaxID=637853 RepID=A0A183EFM7_9BILA